MSFSEVLGQDLAVSILKNSLQQGRLSHAYLFTGVEGVGKDTTAFEFAKAINCKGQANDACDSCISCRKAASGNHPDIKVLKPDGSSIKIDQMRSFQQEILYKPYESEKKVYIIHQTEKMTPEAANSLLKTLEEPPEHGIIILLTNNINQLLPTVISRCQLVRFNRVSNHLIKKRLSENYKLSEQEEELITSLATGKIKEAIALVEEKEKLKKREDIIKLILSFKDLDCLQVFRIVEKLTEYKDQIDQILHMVLVWYRDLLLLKLKKEEQVINIDYMEELKEEVAITSVEQAEKIIQLVEETKNKIRTVNVNLQLTLEVMLLKLNRLRR
ncbi:DNA polymerase III, delta' subunit [Halobacteroides halobius DSM 5150]|uniref:DNA polymerase III subunit delta' n=1 Tax=Halobacteroides halobius (strain ATCC 35273 / DSM 5150 / MD-1) TaxID=748449 RepID=L0K468_HALHC|nr:DNA polymerase III subunit delta' [Halobacteroides halobius]AGB40082.1 DNA polymerase III, delta' subunit [Halobacteroides halobius DSM 5150]